MEIILLLVEFPKTSVQKPKVLEMPKCSCLEKIPRSFLLTLVIREIKKVKSLNFFHIPEDTYVDMYVYHIFIFLDSYTTIPGSKVRHVDVGSVLNITCLVVNYPLKLDYIIFYHNDKV